MFLKKIAFEPVGENDFELFEFKSNSVLYALWFIKDNCAYNEFSCRYNYSHVPKTIKITVNTQMLSTASGEHTTVIFSADEIKKALLYHEKLMELRSKLQREDDSIIDDTTSFSPITRRQYVKVNDDNRIARSLLFLAEARSINYLPFKVAVYITVFECLFTTSTDEVSHKVSERVALYIGGSSEEKKTNFKLMKSAYSLRSKYFHGQQLEKSQRSHEEQVTISKAIDEVLRIIFTKILIQDIETFLSNDTVLNSYFINLIFE